VAAGVVAAEAVDAAGRSDFRQTIDWDQPWMVSLRELGEPLCMPSVDWRTAVNVIACDSGLVTEGGRSIEFVAQSELPAQTNYEAFIHATGKVPTRENLHDFLNALAWLSYPRIKARLNAVQAADVNRAQVKVVNAATPSTRSRLRDALTLFDENAVLVACSEPTLVDLLRAHAWGELFLENRITFNKQCGVFVFGHALVEKLVAPYKAITAHAWLVPVDEDFFTQSLPEKKAYLDACVARQLDEKFRTAAFAPLPVLGIPGWWEGQDTFFYADDRVFRPPRSRSP
jgi:hypothetical protein